MDALRSNGGCAGLSLTVEARESAARIMRPESKVKQVDFFALRESLSSIVKNRVVELCKLPKVRPRLALNHTPNSFIVRPYCCK